jgi:CBS domain-containing protein
MDNNRDVTAGLRIAMGQCVTGTRKPIANPNERQSMKKAADVMTTHVVTIKGFATVAEAAALMKEKGLRALIVEKRIENDAYAMVTESDIIYKVAAYGKDPKRMRVYEIMTKPCVSIPPSMGVEYVARLFANLKLRRAPVVGDQGLQGIISLGDILHKSDFIEKPLVAAMDNQIQEALANARQVCAEKGATSSECAAAWDIVEELQASAAHQRQEKAEELSYEEYSAQYSEEVSNRDYDS